MARHNAQNRRPPVTQPTVGEYKGYPTLTLPLPETGTAAASDFSFGLRKAQAILDNIGDIEQFVAGNLEGGD